MSWRDYVTFSSGLVATIFWGTMKEARWWDSQKKRWKGRVKEWIDLNIEESQKTWWNGGRLSGCRQRCPYNRPGYGSVNWKRHTMPLYKPIYLRVVKSHTKINRRENLRLSCFSLKWELDSHDWARCWAPITSTNGLLSIL